MTKINYAGFEVYEHDLPTILESEILISELKSKLESGIVLKINHSINLDICRACEMKYYHQKITIDNHTNRKHDKHLIHGKFIGIIKNKLYQRSFCHGVFIPGTRIITIFLKT